MQHFELVVGQTVDARPAINKLGLVARLSWPSAAGLRLVTLDGEGDFCHQFGVEDDDVEP